jgi:nucleoside-diphosphate-sugar epimerase
MSGTVGLITISTGEYKAYLPRFIDTFLDKFCVKCSKLFVFTDGQVQENSRVVRIPVRHLGWPAMPLLRFEMLHEYRDLYDTDYLYVIDCDVYFSNSINRAEISGGLVGTLHRNLERQRKDFNYEKRKESTAYISPGEGDKYFACGLYGGETSRVVEMMRVIKDNIRADIKKGIRAIWGDESHINRYFIDHPPDKILSPVYMCPEGNTKFKGKIMHYHKTFKRINLIDAKDYMKINPEDYDGINYGRYRILLTGHKGYIGSRLMAKLRDNHVVYGMDLRVGSDIMYEDAVDNIDIVIHLAAQSGAIPSIKNPLWDARNNILATLRLLEQYPKAKFIFTTSGAATDPQSPYGLSKHTAEKYIKMLHKNYVILRLSSVYGNKDRGVVDTFIGYEGSVTIYGDGSQERDFVHVDDIVDLIEKAIEFPAGSYSCGSGIATTVQEIAEATGKEIVKENFRTGEIKRAVLDNTTPCWAPKIKVLDYIKEKMEEAG